MANSERSRAREFGVRIGSLLTGAANAITMLGMFASGT